MEEDDSILQLIAGLEVRLQRPEIRQAAAEWGKLLANEFIEFGADGRIYRRDEIIAAVVSEPECRYSMADFKAKFLAPDVVLATYRVAKRAPESGAPRYSLRSSIWKNIEGEWKITFHQGTPIGSP